MPVNGSPGPLTPSRVTMLNRVRESVLREGRPYVQWAVGDGATTAFALDRTPNVAADLDVFVGGALLRPAERGTAYDYTLAESRVTLTAAPGAGVNVCFRVWGV